MAPGFDPTDFELGNRQHLLASHPQCADDILVLTPREEEGDSA
jgi:predicted cupin superfamily sugar epimerase